MSLNNQDGRLVVAGDLNFTTVPQFWQQSLHWLSSTGELKFDLTRVTSANSAGLALLIAWIKYAKKAGKKISFNNIPSQINSLMDAAGFSMSSLLAS